jgi:hypothetical protein
MATHRYRADTEFLLRTSLPLVVRKKSLRARVSHEYFPNSNFYCLPCAIVRKVSARERTLHGVKNVRPERFIRV